MIYKNTKKITLILTVLLLASCSQKLNSGSSYEAGPVGVGKGVQDLKKTPCACIEIPMQFPDEFLTAYLPAKNSINKFEA